MQPPWRRRITPRGTGPMTETAPVVLGSEAHKAAFCRMFRETFNPYKPSVIPWPKLDPEALRRLTCAADLGHRGADRGQGAAAHAVLCRRHCATRPCRRRSGRTAGRKAATRRCCPTSSQTYGIALAPEPPYLEPRDPEWAYLVTGFSECIDSFFAFGLFELARQSGYLPAGTGRHVRAGDPGGSAATSCCSPTGWPGTGATSPGGGASASSCGSRRSGFSWSGSASASPAAWATAENQRRRTTTSPSPAPSGQRRRPQLRRADGDLPGRERPPLRRLRCAPAAPDHDAAAGALRAAVHATRLISRAASSTARSQASSSRSISSSSTCCTPASA